MVSNFDLEVAVVTKPVTRRCTLRRASHITNINADEILEAIKKHGGWENDKYEITLVRTIW